MLPGQALKMVFVSFIVFGGFFGETMVSSWTPAREIVIDNNAPHFIRKPTSDGVLPKLRGTFIKLSDMLGH